MSMDNHMNPRGIDKSRETPSNNYSRNSMGNVSEIRRGSVGTRKLTNTKDPMGKEEINITGSTNLRSSLKPLKNVNRTTMKSHSTSNLSNEFLNNRVGKTSEYITNPYTRCRRNNDVGTQQVNGFGRTTHSKNLRREPADTCFTGLGHRTNSRCKNTITHIPLQGVSNSTSSLNERHKRGNKDIENQSLKNNRNNLLKSIGSQKGRTDILRTITKGPFQNWNNHFDGLMGQSIPCLPILSKTSSSLRVGNPIRDKNVEAKGVHLREKQRNMHTTSILVKEVFVATSAGTDGEGSRKVNQDAHFVIIDAPIGKKEHVSIFGVADGHGVNGRDVSDYVRVTVTENLLLLLKKAYMKSSLSPATFVGCLKDAYDLTNRSLASLVDVTFSGTTLVVAVMYRNQLFVANAGDSRALFLQNCQGGVIALSRDHKPDSERELARIKKNEGFVSPYMIATENGSVESFGPARVWVKDQIYPGLAMSRSLGDLCAASVGCISTPDVSIFYWGDEGTGEGSPLGYDQFDEQFIILMSDGITEFLSDGNIANIVCSCFQRNNEITEDPSKCLIKESHKKWIEEQEAMDDCTAIIVQLNGNGK